MSAKAQHLIDVRTPAEFSTGYLGKAVNIEYQLIHQLPEIIPSAQKDDKITLYCRSGRRSAIAMDALKRLGYKDVRDIGGFEEARMTLAREEMEKGTLDENIEKLAKSEEKDGVKKQAREKALSSLLAGLRGEETVEVSQTVAARA